MNRITYTTEDRERFINDNAVAMVTGLEAKVARYRKLIKKLEQSRSDLRRLLEKQKCRGCGCVEADNFWCDECTENARG